MHPAIEPLSAPGLAALKRILLEDFVVLHQALFERELGLELFLRALAGSKVVPSLLPIDVVTPPVLDLLFRIHFSEPPARFILVPPLQRVAVRGQKRWREKEDQVRGS